MSSLIDNQHLQKLFLEIAQYKISRKAMKKSNKVKTKEKEGRRHKLQDDSNSRINRHAICKIEITNINE